MQYRMYVDEVGNADLGSSDDPNHRFLSLTGVIVHLQSEARVIHADMEAIKSEFFGGHPDEPVVFHRKDILNAREAFRPLIDPDVRSRFDAQILEKLRSWTYTVISVCIDKKAHKERYAVWRYEPYHYCMAVLLERYVFFLNRTRAKGDVMAESRGRESDLRLKDSFQGLWRRGTDHVDQGQFQGALSSRELKVKPKAMNIAGLQLADLLAHPSRNEILSENGLLDKPIAPFAQNVIAVLRAKYDQRGGRIYGKKML